MENSWSILGAKNENRICFSILALVLLLLHCSIFANDANSGIKKSKFFIIKISKTL